MSSRFKKEDLYTCIGTIFKVFFENNNNNNNNSLERSEDRKYICLRFAGYNNNQSMLYFINAFKEIIESTWKSI